MSGDTALLDLLQDRRGSLILATHTFRGQATAVVRREGLLEVAGILKDDPISACDFLMDLTCVDYLSFDKIERSAATTITPSPLPYLVTPKKTSESWDRHINIDEYRFEMVYHFFSSRHHHRVRIKVPIPGADPGVDSLTSLWLGANWFEREVWDMFGVAFRGHPNLKRILMYEPFEGHPLRKDYPVWRRQPLLGPVN